MFFEINVQNSTITGMVGRDGLIYFYSALVAKFLLYRSIDYFTSKYSTHILDDVALDNIKKKFSKRFLKTRIMRRDKLTTLLEKRKHKRFRELKSDCFFVIEIPRCRRFWPTLKLCSPDEAGAVPFSSWIEAFKKDLVDKKLLLPSLVESSLLPPSSQTSSPRYSPTSPDYTPQFTVQSSEKIPSSQTSSPRYSPSSPEYTPQFTVHSYAKKIPSSQTSSPRYSPSSPEYTPEFNVQSSAKKMPPSSPECTPEFTVQSSAPKTPSFMLWMNSIPPSKIYTFHENEKKTFVPKKK